MSKTDQNTTKKSIPFEVTAEGSLGLLALGAVGVKAWKQKRREEQEKNKKKKENE